MADSRKLFVNLPVRNLQKSKDFFGALGFSFNPQFTDENAACMVLSDEAFVMLLQEPYFKTFTKRPTVDARQQTEGIYALTADSKAEVDETLKKALAGGATEAMPNRDLGFMYSVAFYDLDGHHWEVLWMDPGFVQK